jgi:hypothetical protein
MRATLSIVADSPEEVEALGRMIDVEVESVTVGVDGELLQRQLRPLLIEHCSLYAADGRDERKGPLVRIHIAPAEDPSNDTDSDSERPARAAGRRKE